MLNWARGAVQFPKQLEGEAIKLIHHSVLRKDDLVNKLHEAIRASKPADEDQKQAADQQQQQLPAEAAAQAANVTKKLLTHFLVYVRTLSTLVRQEWCILQLFTRPNLVFCVAGG